MGLPRGQRLRHQDEFRKVLATGRKAADGLLAVAATRNDTGLPRFGFSISKRIGGAVVRNRLKRRLQEILRKQEFNESWDVVVTARPQASTASFDEVTASLIRLLQRMKIGNAPGRSANPTTDTDRSPSG